MIAITRSRGRFIPPRSILLFTIVLSLYAPAIAQWAGRSDDGISHPPSAVGSLAYNTFVPLPGPGASYLDPVFGTTVLRVTSDRSPDDIYARNMWWNADETR